MTLCQEHHAAPALAELYWSLVDVSRVARPTIAVISGDDR
jgi:hypothetical protein